MKYLKWPLLILLALIVIYLVMCLLGPKNMNTSRSVKIETAPAFVFNQLNDLEKWPSWSPWAKMDTAMVIDFGNQTEGVGANYKWEGPLSGSGDLEIIESNKNESARIKMNMHDYNSTSFIDFKIKTDGNAQEVTWEMEDEEDLPFLARGVMLVRGMKGQMKNQFDEGLANIKAIAETHAKGEYNGHLIKPVQVEDRHYILNRQEIDIANIQKYFAGNFVSLLDVATKSGVSMEGKPSGLFYSWNESTGKTDMAAAIPVSESLSIKDASSVTVRGGNALQIDYYGDFEGSIGAHMAMEDYLKDHGLVNNLPIVEEYLVDASKEPDPKKWLTRISYLIAE